jgi:hypothetical protein
MRLTLVYSFYDFFYHHHMPDKICLLSIAVIDKRSEFVSITKPELAYFLSYVILFYPKKEVDK